MIEDQTIRRFLLGDLEPAEQSRFEHSFLMDDELSERVRLAELELCDDYAAACLTRGEQAAFRERFLLTANRAQTLNVSKTLHNSFARPAFRSDYSVFQRVTNIFDLRRHAWKYAFAMLVLVLLVVTAVLVKKERPRIAGPSKPPGVAPRSSATATPQSAHHSTNSAAPAHTEKSPVLPLHEGLTTSVVLVGSTPLESSPVITASGEVVTLELKLDQPLAEFYDANVMTLAGESVFMANALKRTEEETISFDLPTGAIESGDFQVALMRLDGDTKRSAGTYYFRVR